MREVFADTFYWIALANPNDEWHETAKQVSRSLGPVRMVTTDEVLTEFLTWFASHGPMWRQKAVAMVRSIRANPNVRTLAQTRSSFDRALRLYETRPDKAFSLTDCSSMEVMRENGWHEVLTNDRHFEQEGFGRLITEKLA